MQPTIPDLNTQFIAPLYDLQRKFLTHQAEIENWFNQEWQKSPPPVYGSVDLRNAGFKLAPIDMNLFPAGFNNLNPDFLHLAVLAAKKVIHRIAKDAKKILVVPESHTRNLFYWANIKILEKILTSADFEVCFGTLSENLTDKEIITLPSGETVNVLPLIRNDNQLRAGEFVPDLILLNNDLSEGIPPILQSLTTPLVPPAELGWSQRLKSDHFQYYAKIVNEFSQVTQIDPWLIAPLFRNCGSINFMQQEGLDCLIHHAKELFAEIKAKYERYQISEQPFLIIKADAGTYGMAVMTVRHPDELRTLNRKQRTRMSSTKGNQPVDKVIIQEGVYTFEMFGDAVAEPVVYLFGESVVGGFYRVHKERGVDENLNAPGMHFEPLPFTESCHTPCEKTPEACRNRFYLYGIIAQLSMLAAAREMKEQWQK